MRKFNGILLAAFLMLPALVQAAQYDIKEMTPEIQQALQNRQLRYDELQRLKAQGILGENAEGYVEVLKNAVLEANSIAAAENKNRRVIYNAIVQQNNLPPSGIDPVQAAFADVQREKARPGDFIQSSNGQWTQKDYT